MSDLRFSVVMLLPEARGLAERSARSWVAEQDFARDRFELVVVSNGREPDVEARVPPLLCKSDRLLLHPGATRTELYDRGARAARGEFILLTESHCVAEPTFLRELDQFLRSSDAAGACCRSVSMCDDTLSRLAAKCFEDGYREYCRPDDWRKVNIHSFALRREVYLEASGLNPRYGIFAEMLLADELRRRGHRLEYAEVPGVWHRFDGSAAESAEFNADAVAGEMRYHRDHPHGPRIGHTFLADGDVPWSERELERAAFAALWAERTLGPALRQGWRALKVKVREGRLGRAADRAAMVVSATACRVIGSEFALAKRLYLRSWAAAARLARKAYLATELPGESHPNTGSFQIDEIPDRDLWGFHLPERWQGEPMRWTGRCAVMRLPRPAGASELVLHTRGVGWPVADRRCAFFVDGHRVPDRDVSVELLRIRLRLEPATKPTPLLLAMVCDPVPPEVRGAEPRELGFPLFRVEVRAASEVAIPLRAAA